MQTHFSQTTTSDVKTMAADLLLVEQAVLQFFTTHDQDHSDVSTFKAALVSALSSHGKTEETIDKCLALLSFVVKKDDKVSLVQRKMHRGAEGAACVFSFSCPNTPVGEETMYQRISRESSTLAGIRNFVKVAASQLGSLANDSPKKEPDAFRFVAQSITKESFQVKFLSGSYAYAVAVQELAKRDAKWKQLATITI